jgi:acetylornithine/succinyldiaminopimelate/putrescine aminotransferase
LVKQYPEVLRGVRGLGLMLGLELVPNLAKLPGDPNKTQAVRFANLLHSAGLLAVPAGAQILRLLPPLNLRRNEAEEGLKIVESVAARLAP